MLRKCAFTEFEKEFLYFGVTYRNINGRNDMMSTMCFKNSRVVGRVDGTELTTSNQGY